MKKLACAMIYFGVVAGLALTTAMAYDLGKADQRSHDFHCLNTDAAFYQVSACIDGEKP